MFTNDEKKFIKSQDWFNEFSTVGLSQINSDLIHCLKQKEKSKAYQSIQKLNISDAGIVVFYGKILTAVEKLGNLDNCSVILQEQVNDSNIAEIKYAIFNFLRTNTNCHYECKDIVKHKDQFIIKLTSFGEVPYEDFDVDYELWNTFLTTLNKKYKADFNIPSSYWGK